MIAPERLIAEPALEWTPFIAADALVRIPTADFRDMDWAKEAITRCAELFLGSQRVDQRMHWIDTTASADAPPILAVLRAVGDALVADAFGRDGNMAAVSEHVASVENHVLGRVLLQREIAAERDDDPRSSQLVSGLVRLMGLHDSGTAAHLAATARIAGRISTALGLSERHVRTIERAAELHDIGNLGLSKDLLAARGGVTPAERTAIEAHATKGAALLLDIPRLASLAPIVRAHHERIDGSGYPDRLRATEIPLAARVIAVADAFETLTTRRSHCERPLSETEALAVLADGAGTQFDADVVAAAFDAFAIEHRKIA